MFPKEPYQKSRENKKIEPETEHRNLQKYRIISSSVKFFFHIFMEMLEHSL